MKDELAPRRDGWKLVSEVPLDWARDCHLRIEGGRPVVVNVKTGERLWLTKNVGLLRVVRDMSPNPPFIDTSR